ncbi:unnamed protein product [Mytilus edulis]|uniref:Endonuclease-reverse transcriptase n=1 Tax=Mytilus edulis TaxID=6550 RepID=A0A8S3V281_MYTED|nr:unnamed protein product [Mytilus edulis]
MTRRPMELFSTKLTTRIGTWNVRTLYQSGKCAQVAKEMDRYKIEILGLSEVRWNTSGMTNLNTGHTIIYSGNTKQNNHTKRELKNGEKPKKSLKCHHKTTKRQTQDLYIEKDKEVKKNCKQDKRNYVEQLAQEAEIACSKGDMKYLYNTTKQLSGRRSNSNATVKEKNGNVITKIEEQLKRWKYHFEEVLNRPPQQTHLTSKGDRS